MANSVYRWFDPDGPSTAEEVGRSFADILLDGLCGASAQSRS